MLHNSPNCLCPDDGGENYDDNNDDDVSWRARQSAPSK